MTFAAVRSGAAPARLAALLYEAVDPDRARDTAREILGGRHYRTGETPRPFAGILRWIGDRFRPVGDFFDRVIRWAGDRLGTVVDFLASPAGLMVLGAALAAAVIVAIVLARRRRIQRADGEGQGETGTVGADGTGADELERLADEADRRGEHGLAIRLRFRAGLVRLDATRAIRLRPSLTSGQLARQLRRPEVDDLAVTFDAVAYGGRPGSVAQSDRARATWPRVVADTRPAPRPASGPPTRAAP